MKNKLVKKLLAAVLAATLVAGMLVGCGNNTTTNTPTTGTPTKGADPTKAEEPTKAPTEAPKDPVVIKYGSHWIPELDPNYKDEVTGEYTMAEDRRQAALAGLKAIKDAYNVEFEFVQYTEGTDVALMKSVLAGDPYCDIATLWNGIEATVLGQNVLQPIDKWADIFNDEETSWMLDDKTYGHYYLLSFPQVYVPYFTFIYNATLVEKAGLEDPAAVYLKGEWTWSKFEEYCTKLNAFYANTPADGAVDSANGVVKAYVTDYRYAGLAAMFSNGGAIYDSTGIAANNEKTVAACQWIKKLLDNGLLVENGYGGMWDRSAQEFQKGNTVFTDCPNWWLGGTGNSLSERGESQGIVPYPRADRLAKDSDEYGMPNTVGDSCAILKGVSEEKAELAVKSYRLFWKTFYETLGSDWNKEAANRGLDITNEKFGKDILECFKEVKKNLKADMSGLLGFKGTWETIFGKSLYGEDGTSSDYAVAVETVIPEFQKVATNMEAILSSGEVHDNVAPEVKSGVVVVPVGTDLTKIDVTKYWTATDQIDGELDVTKGRTEWANGFDGSTAKVGIFEKAIKMIVADKSGNENSSRAMVVVFNPDNKTAPTVKVKAELPKIAVDKNPSEINWADFLESAVDADGLDVTKVAENISADISKLDTSTPGEYTLTLTVKDYAGNSVEETIKVVVE